MKPEIQQLPQDKEIERAVLESLLREPTETVRPTLEAGGELLFYNPTYMIIFKAIEHLYEDAGDLDQLTVTEHLRKSGQLDMVGGTLAIDTLAADFVTSANIHYHLKILKDKTALRKLISATGVTRAACYETTADPADILHNHETNIAECKEFLEKKRLNIAEQVREWVVVTDGDFSVTDCYRELNFVTTRDKSACRTALNRLSDSKKANVIEATGNRRGWYRKVDDSLVIMDVMNAPTTPFDIKWPLGIEEYALIYPGNVIIIAGETNSGKTSFMINFARLNMNAHKIRYMNSEMGESELRINLEKFEDVKLNEWPVEWIERSENHSDVVIPNGINIIDYIEIYEDHYKLAGQIAKIHRKLDKGIAIIAIQKPANRDEGVGGSSTKDKCRLYLSMEFGKMKLTKVKAWGPLARYGVGNPNNMYCDFDIVRGSEIRPSERGWYRQND